MNKFRPTSNYIYIIVFTKMIFFIFLLISFFIIRLNFSSPAQAAGNWELVFEDEFDGNTLDDNKWTPCFRWGTSEGCDQSGIPNAWYRPENVFVSNGTLKLRGKRESFTNTDGQTFDYTSGMVATNRWWSEDRSDYRFTFQYGLMEARVKVPAGQGIHTAFWTLPLSNTWPPEIDIFEILGHRQDRAHLHYHFNDESGKYIDNGGHWVGPDFSQDWHTFAVEWSPEALIWYIDGVERKRFTEKINIVSEPMYLILSLQVGGHWPGEPDHTTPFPSDFEIDYVRVYQRSDEPVHCTPLGDIDCSGKVNALDFGQLFTKYKTFDPKADLDDSGLVDAQDVSIYLGNYGKITTLSSPHAFHPTADASVYMDSPGSNYGSSSSLEMDYSPKKDFFVKFDVAGVEGNITGAKLRLHCTDPGKAGGAFYTAGNLWQENTITWNNKPGKDVKLTDIGAVNPGQWYEFDVSSVVGGNGTYSFGFDTTSDDGADFYSREAANKNYRPELVVSFE